MLFDSHVHFDTSRGEHGITALVERAIASGVTELLAVGGSPALNRHAVAAARLFPHTVRAAIGWDRDQALDKRRRGIAQDPQAMLHYWSNRIDRCRRIGIQISALGEIGLDYHYAADTASDQRRLLRTQLATARALHLPVIIHTRDADADTIALLEEHVSALPDNTPFHPGVVHCFTGTTEFACRLLALGFFIGLSGIITFANAKTLRETAKTIPSTKLLIETDTPYLAPVPYRGHRNQPSFLPAILQCLAEIRSESAEHLAEITRANALALFSQNSSNENAEAGGSSVTDGSESIWLGQCDTPPRIS